MLRTQTIANTILMLSFEEGIPVTPMKLQKLVYCVYKKALQDTGDKLFSEPFEAWKYGPVLPSIYYEFSSFQSSAINKFARAANGDVEIVDLSYNSPAANAIDYIWNKYKNFSGVELSKFTHNPDTAYLKQDRCAFTENIEAWQFGPIVPCVYYMYCGVGSMRICVKFTPEEDLQPEDKAIIDPIVESKRDLMPWDLVNDVHRKGGAWDVTFKNGEGLRAIIPTDLIRSNG